TPARHRDAAVVEVRLGHRLEAPVERVDTERDTDGPRDAGKDVARPAPGFDQAYGAVGVLAEARRQHAAGRASPDDDVIKPLSPFCRHRLNIRLLLDGRQITTGAPASSSQIRPLLRKIREEHRSGCDT